MLTKEMLLAAADAAERWSGKVSCADHWIDKHDGDDEWSNIKLKYG